MDPTKTTELAGLFFCLDYRLLRYVLYASQIKMRATPFPPPRISCPLNSYFERASLLISSAAPFGCFFWLLSIIQNGQRASGQTIGCVQIVQIPTVFVMEAFNIASLMIFKAMY
jgi:hypothetical protein